MVGVLIIGFLQWPKPLQVSPFVQQVIIGWSPVSRWRPTPYAASTSETSEGAARASSAETTLLRAGVARGPKGPTEDPGDKHRRTSNRRGGGKHGFQEGFATRGGSAG